MDGTYPSGTTAYEKRNISELVAVWDSDSCIQCGNCGFVCPHSVIRSKFYDESQLAGAPEEFDSAPLDAVGLPNARFSLQVYVEDCTGCGLCVEACPVVIPGPTVTKAINLGPAEPRVVAERENIGFFESLPTNDRSRVDFGTVRGNPVPAATVRVLRRLRGLRRDAVPQAALPAVRGPADDRQRHRLLVDLRRQPAHHAWATDADGRGPAWSNSLFEDNAEFGLRPAVGQRRDMSSWPADASPSCARPSVPSSSTPFWRRRSCGSRSWPPSVSGWASSRTASAASIRPHR